MQWLKSLLWIRHSSFNNLQSIKEQIHSSFFVRYVKVGWVEVVAFKFQNSICFVNLVLFHFYASILLLNFIILSIFLKIYKSFTINFICVIFVVLFILFSLFLELSSFLYRSTFFPNCVNCRSFSINISRSPVSKSFIKQRLKGLVAKQRTRLVLCAACIT